MTKLGIPSTTLAITLATFVWNLAPAQDRKVTYSSGPESPSRLEASLFLGQDGEYYVLDRTDSEVLVVDENSIVAATDQAPAFEDAVADLDAALEDVGSFVPESDTTGRLTLPGEDDETFRLESKSAGRLIDARLLRAVDARRFIIQEELDLTTPTRIVVRRFIVAYDSGDDQTGMAVAEVNVGELEIVDDSYIAVVDDTRAIYLREQDGSIELDEVSLTTEIEPGTPDADESSNLEEPLGDADFDADRFQRLVRRSSPEPDLDALREPLTRERVQANARAFLDAQWVLEQRHFGDGRSNACLPENREDRWRRPKRLDHSVGRTVSALPYKWGGYMSTEQFAARLMQPKTLAGDDCTCREQRFNWCIEPDAAGVDCSGFVSQVWEIDYHSTTHLPAVTMPISLVDMKPGDAFNKPGSHVQLFLGFEDEFKTSVRVIESATFCGGVCESTKRIAQLNGYEPVRLDELADR